MSPAVEALRLARRAARAATRPVLRQSTRILGTITHVTTSEPLLALTFDDGPHPDSTPRVLEVLSAHGARGTFFMIGELAVRHPALVREVAGAGHAIGNHSWDHRSFRLLRGADRRAQIRTCEAVLRPHGSHLFRPPYGHQSLPSRLDAWRMGYRVVTYSAAACDWLDHDADWMAAKVLREVRPGSIVLWHDHLYTSAERRYVDRRTMLESLRLVLDRLAGRYAFVTLPELLARGRVERAHWYMRPDPELLRRLVARDVASSA